jgi:hypothetical protein
MSSGFLRGVARDAEHVVEAIAARAKESVRGQAEGSSQPTRA